MSEFAKEKVFKSAIEGELEKFRQEVLEEKTVNEAWEACLLAQSELIETLDENQSEIYDNIVETNDDYTDFLLKACFNAGVELGMKLMGGAEKTA